MQFTFSGPKALKKELLAKKPEYQSLSNFILTCVAAGMKAMPSTNKKAKK